MRISMLPYIDQISVHLGQFLVIDWKPYFHSYVQEKLTPYQYIMASNESYSDNN